MKNFALDKLKNGKKIIGCWNTMASTCVTDVLASSGLDYIFLDLEHGPYNLSDIVSYSSICEKHGTSLIVRVPSSATWMSLQALDQGAHGVICPQLETVEEVKSFVDSCYYSEKGNRGYTPFSCAGKYGAKEDYINVANDNVLSSIIVETKAAVENFDEIISIPNLNLIFFGTYDLSRAYNFPGGVKDESMISMIKELIVKANSKGIFVGGFLAQSKEDLEWQRDLDLDLVVYGVDSYLLKSVVEEGVKNFKSL